MKNINYIIIAITVIIASVIVGCMDNNPTVLKFRNGGASSSSSTNNGTNDGDNNGDNADGACNTESDCSDGDACTVDACVNGQCVFVDVVCPNGFECNALGQCVAVQQQCRTEDDNDPCTVDVCDPLSGETSHTPRSCDDGNDFTVDACNVESGECEHFTCSDEDACTDDILDPETGECRHREISCGDGFSCEQGTCVPRCTTHSQCSDGSMCTRDMCDLETGQCINEMRDCNDGDDTTVDRCLETDEAPGWACENLPTACTDGCDDGNPCTADFCVEADCVHQTLPCGEGTHCSQDSGLCEPDFCNGMEDCDDGNPCTTDHCLNGACVHNLDICAEDEVCDAESGSCVTPRGCEDGCDDGDDATVDFCDEGVCRHHQPVDCGGGTVLDPNTGECVPAQGSLDCTDGDVECRQFENSRTIVYAVCQSGNWVTQQVCGPIDGGTVCIEGRGCVSR